MEETNSEKPVLEVLISTMDRDSLDFLSVMFPNDPINDFKILIVNQTNNKNILRSNRDHIRVINSFEKGLSKSRNLAIKNAESPIVLLADDDVIYEHGFNNTVIKSYKNYMSVAAMTFKIKGSGNRPIRKYPNKDRKHSIGTIFNVLSVEIALNLRVINSEKTLFNVAFGLGSKFPIAEEFLYLRELYKSGYEIVYKNEFIATHISETSGSEQGADNIVYARAALNYNLYGILAYLWVFKYVFFLLRHNYIEYTEIIQKITTGFKGISDYKHHYRPK